MKNSFDKHAEKFTALMVKKITSLTTDWSKPWFSKPKSKTFYLPQNLSGRSYSGGNAFLLFFLCEEFNYKTPVFLTFNQAKAENVCVLKGSESFPVYYTMYCAIHREDKTKISLDEFKRLSKEEQKEWRILATNKYFNVFNLDQTNFAEIHPERWEVLKNKFAPAQEPTEEAAEVPEMYENTILDKMLADQTWACKIEIKNSDRAYFAPLKDLIVLPLKSQFVDGESFYCTTLHEMAHSTGTAERLNRKGIVEMSGPKDEYGREELVAELTAALSALFFGVCATIRDENAAYLKGWCKAIKEEPKFLFSVLTDAMKASKFIANALNFQIETEAETEQEEAQNEAA